MIDLVNRLGNAWGLYFGYAVVQNTVFICLIFLSLRLLRRAPAKLKYAICLIGIVKLLLPPFVPASFRVGSTAGISQISGVMITIPGNIMPAGADALQSHPTRLNVAGLVMLIWAAGIVFYLGTTLVSTLRLKAALASATPLDAGAWVDGRFGDRVQIYRSGRIAMPLTLGLIPRRIYVPQSWDRWSDKCRRMVVSHELAHIRRWDGLTQALQILAVAVYVFNPLVWWLNRRMNQYREMACDDAVVAGDRNEAVEYSGYLVGLAEAVAVRSGTLGPASALFRCRNGLLERINHQLKEEIMPSVSWTRKGLVLTALMAIVLPLSLYCGGTDTGHDMKADAGAAVPGKYEGMEIVQIGVKGDGEITVDGEVTPLENLGPRLDEITATNRDKALIFLTSEGDVTMDLIRRIQDALVRMDLRKIVYDKAAGGFDDLTLVLPSEGDQERLQQIPKEHVAILEMGPGSRASFDGESIDLFEIPEAVAARISEDPYLVVVIRALGSSAFDDFATALALAKKGGATRISIEIPPPSD